MSSWAKALLVAALAAAATMSWALGRAAYPGIGRDATPREVAAWDIDVRADFKGLPPGSGSVAKGQAVWEAKCASCHGVFGESNQMFNPLVGGTSKDDIKTGHVASLKRNDYPGRTTLMKASNLSTLWDYINRAMPWSQPKSLSVEEVYAVTAYLLNLGDILPADFTLSDRNMAQVQQLLPNRNGVTTAHGLWPGRELGGTGKPDVAGTACMKDCAVDAKLTSMLPAFARNAHGNLAEQNRTVGAQRGIETGLSTASAPQAGAAGPSGGTAVQALTQKNNCMACHAPNTRIVGPSWSEIAGKHPGKADYIAAKIRSGGAGVWGAIPMPPQTLDEAEAASIASWLAGGAKP
ncbi:MAG: c-type cytochrome [Ramlibacter sp.]